MNETSPKLNTVSELLESYDDDGELHGIVKITDPGRKLVFEHGSKTRAGLMELVRAVMDHEDCSYAAVLTMMLRDFLRAVKNLPEYWSNGHPEAKWLKILARSGTPISRSTFHRRLKDDTYKVRKPKRRGAIIIDKRCLNADELERLSDIEGH